MRIFVLCCVLATVVNDVSASRHKVYSDRRYQHDRFNINPPRELEYFNNRQTDSHIYQKQDKIAGGYYAKEGQFPFMALVHRMIDGAVISQCGGTIISERWVLTAGHCIEFPHQYLVQFGLISKTNRASTVSMLTSHAITHPDYFHSINDIGLLYMPSDIPFTREIQPIQLAGRNDASLTFADLTAYVIGWGREERGTAAAKSLKYTVLPILENSECAQFWKVDETNICTAPGLGENACQGDSGGPLVVFKNSRPLQIGIVSYGDANCPSGRPGVFTRITAFASWIEEVSKLTF